MKLGIFILIIGCALVAPVRCAPAAQERPSSGELILRCWEAHGKKDQEATLKATQELIYLYKDEADQQQASLKALPESKEEIGAVTALNDVATAYFIQGESYRYFGKEKEAIESFRTVVEKYPYAQAWDQRGWFWRVAKTSQESIDQLEGRQPVKQPEKEKIKVSQAPTGIVLYDPGKDSFPVDYTKYGGFANIGTKDYKYIVKDQEGLSAAVGEGIYPNTTSVKWDPEFKKAMKDKRLEGVQWDFLQSPDLEAAFLKWATSTEPQGVKLFYTALILEKAGLIEHALKCYYAIVVHFPGSYSWTYWHTPWYVGQAAIAKIRHILKNNPAIGYKLVDADIRVINGFDLDVSNDSVITTPGRFVKVGFWERLIAGLWKPGELLSIKRRSGKGKVYVVQYENNDWQLMVDKKPYIIKGITYAPTKVGQSPDEGTMTSWMEDDFNANGRIDGPYDAFVDSNGNNRQDRNEPSVGDFRLMRDMGVNTIRLYHQPRKIDKVLLRELYDKFGLRVIMGDFLGKYALGSGAAWNPGTDYNNEEQKKNMIQSVTNMVLEYKDEPYILFWLLGNENVYGYACNADKYPSEYFAFANQVARYIKDIDPQHPVAICSGDVLYLDIFGRECPDVDIFGTNAYRGGYGFGSLWQQVKEEADKPAFITEFGCPAFADGLSADKAEEAQAAYLKSAWQDVIDNSAFHWGAGNAVGAVVFEWLDEWWKAYEPKTHDTHALWAGPFPDGYMHEEWLGVAGQGDGSQSPFLRHLRKSYYMYRKEWR